MTGSVSAPVPAGSHDGGGPASGRHHAGRGGVRSSRSLPPARPLRNVWWEDVGEDAATLRGSGTPAFLVDGGGARSASDKVFQHNGPGTLTIRNFQASNFGTFYRSCGNCSTQTRRNVVIQNVTLTRPGNTVAGINTNYGDTARFTGITIVNDSGRVMVICRKYIGNNTGDEPTQVGTGADGVNCIYSSSDITYR